MSIQCTQCTRCCAFLQPFWKPKPFYVDQNREIFYKAMMQMNPAAAHQFLWTFLADYEAQSIAPHIQPYSRSSCAACHRIFFGLFNKAVVLNTLRN